MNSYEGFYASADRTDQQRVTFLKIGLPMMNIHAL